MSKREILSASVLAAVAVVALTSAALADRRGHGMMEGGHGEGMMGGQMMMMGEGPMEGGPLAMIDFDAIDADKDGKITKEELAAHRAARVTAADADKDGKLSAEELAAMSLVQMQARAQERATRMIAAMDADGDKMLSAAELVAGHNPMPMLDRLDADGDGAVSKEELEAARARMQQRMDGRMGGGMGHGMGSGMGMGSGNN